MVLDLYTQENGLSKCKVPAFPYGNSPQEIGLEFKALRYENKIRKPKMFSLQLGIEPGTLRLIGPCVHHAPIDALV